MEEHLTHSPVVVLRTIPLAALQSQVFPIIYYVAGQLVQDNELSQVKHTDGHCSHKKDEFNEYPTAHDVHCPKVPLIVRVQVIQLATLALQPKQATVEQSQVLVPLRVYPVKQEVQLPKVVQVAQVGEQTKHELLSR